jgi:hypothetical protein
MARRTRKIGQRCQAHSSLFSPTRPQQRSHLRDTMRSRGRLNCSSGGRRTWHSRVRFRWFGLTLAKSRRRPLRAARKPQLLPAHDLWLPKMCKFHPCRRSKSRFFSPARSIRRADSATTLLRLATQQRCNQPRSLGRWRTLRCKRQIQPRMRSKPQQRKGRLTSHRR